MGNPRFAEENIVPMREADGKSIPCTKCARCAGDQKFGSKTVKGATLGRCEAYFIKPFEVMHLGKKCPKFKGKS